MDYEKMSKEELIDALKESQEISKGLLKLMELNSLKMTEIAINSLQEQLRLRHKFLSDLENEQPPKFFKSTHKEWQDKINSIKNEIDDLDKKLFEEYKDYGKSIENLNKKNEDND